MMSGPLFTDMQSEVQGGSANDLGLHGTEIHTPTLVAALLSDGQGRVEI